MPMHRLRRATLVATAALVVLPAVASAAPVTVNLRIEGPTQTVFEGPVTTDLRTFHFSDSPATTHVCDGTAVGGYGGPSATPVPTRNAALVTAAEQNGFPLLGSFGQYGAGFTTIGTQNVDYDPGSGRYLAEYKNGQFSNYGGCGDPIVTGDEVLYAFADGSETLLGLSGPAKAALGAPVPVKVSDLGSPATGVAGATVDGHSTGADGTATVGPFTTPGDHDLKATKTGAIRSSRLRVCVTTGDDGYCGTSIPTPTTTTPTTPVPPPCASNGHDGLCGSPDTDAGSGQLTGITEQQKFSKPAAPRTLTGKVTTTGAGVKLVEAKLTRKLGKVCETFSGARAQFVRAACGAQNGRWFEVGTTADWSFLLPAALSPGRYVLDTRVTDTAGNVDTKLQRGRNRIVFFVR